MNKKEIKLNSQIEADAFIAGLYHASCIYEIYIEGKDGAEDRATKAVHTILSAHFPHYYDTKEVN